MRAVFGLVLAAGLGLAGGAVYMAKEHIAKYEQALAHERAAKVQAVDTVPVFVANRTLKYGERLRAGDIREVAWPKSALPEGVFTDRAALVPSNEDELRVVLRPMEINEPIMLIKVTEPGEDAGITSRLDKGMRAFALRVDVASGVSGFLRPGDVIDVYWTGRVTTAGVDGRTSNNEVTKLIEAGVKLIAVDQTASNDMSRGTIARTVTVSASPQQVAAFAQAQSTGRLSLSLVGAEDTENVAEVIEVDQNSLLGIQAAPIQQAQRAPRVCTIRTRRGAQVVELPIPCSN